MKSIKKLAMGTLAASVMATGALTTTAHAGELSASATVANMYLWRGIDLGQGDAAVSGDIVYTGESGVYGGVWMSSGDVSLGSEYDLFVGWSREVGDLGIDISLWNYNYSDLDSTDGDDDETLGELSEIIFTLSYKGFAFSAYNNVAGEGFCESCDEYEYYTLSYSHGPYSVLYGIHEVDDDDSDMSHLDFTYAYNDNLSFTVSKVVDEEDQDDGSTYDDDPLFVVSYSLPIN
jgi:uncharacterized protein (TIGR02001 family)